MSDEFERRIAANEDMFRRVNEGIERGQWPGWAGGEAESPIAFRCECARLGCNMLLNLTLADYQRVRSHPRRFVLVKGHELPGQEHVVETLGEIVIVEKVGEAGEEARERDPRD
jgi:hypothetical protein